MRRAIGIAGRACLAGAAGVMLAACAGTPADEADGAGAPNNSVGDTVGAAPAAVSGPEAEAGGASAAADEGAHTVLIAGTSLTAGLGIAPEDAYPAVLQRMADSAGLAARVVNAGLSGETSAGLLRRIDWLLREPADVVVIETGANDGLRGLDPDSTRENLRRIVARVRAALPDAQVLLVQMEAPPNLGERYTARFRAMYGEVARETGAGLVPFLLEGIAGEGTLNQADGIHPNEEGARRAARIVWSTLAPVLDSLDRLAESG